MTIETMQANPTSVANASVNSARAGASQSEQVNNVNEVEKPSLVAAGQESAEDTGTLSTEQLEEAVTKLNELMKDGQRSLAFTVDSDSEEVVVKVMDTTTEEVIRQIPNEEALRFAEHVEGMLGVIFNDKA